MSSNAQYTDADVTKLRAIVAVIEQEIVQAPPTQALRAAWAELVGVLALGSARRTHCWAALEPLPPPPDEASPGGNS